MTEINSLNELVRRGDEILRIPMPALRQRQWRRWRDQVRNIMQDNSALKTLGLRLKVNHLAADVGILSRYDRLIQTQPHVADNLISRPNNGNGLAARSVTVEVDEYEIANLDEDGKIKIFISHKHEDERTAIGLKAAIERYGAGRVQIFLSEDTPTGSNWINWIQKSLSKSNLFILVFTDASRNWDWPLYEAGLFTRLDDIEGRPLICLHSENLTPPPPLRHLQSVPANIDEIKRFLKNLFVRANLQGISKPLNPAMAEQPEELERAATEIVDLVSRHTVKIDYFSRYLFVNIGYSENGSIPKTAKVISNSSTLEMFGLGNGDWTWEDILTQANKDDDRRWLSELENAICDASKGRLFKSIQATFKSRKEAKQYRPMLYRLDTLADGSRIAKILFTEDVSWNVSQIPRRQGILSTALVMAVRFRYEVLKQFESMFLSNRNHEDTDEQINELVQAISNIEIEASSRGLLNEKELINAFNGNEEKQQIKKMYDEWYDIRSSLLSENKPDGNLIEDQISTLLNLNIEFINVAMKRFCELLAQE